MGWKPTRVSEFSYLGMRVIRVAFKAGYTHLFLLDSSTIYHMSSPINFQAALKNSAVNPSSPGALFRGMFIITSSTSYILISLSNARFYSLVIIEGIFLVIL